MLPETRTFHRVVHEREQRDAGGVGAQRAGTQAGRTETVRLEQAISKSFQPPSGPTASRTRSPSMHRATVRSAIFLCAPGRPPDEARREQAVQLVFDQHFELSMDRNVRSPGVARLLQPFDQQWPVALRRQHVRVE